jgi:hypothetical protein
LKRFITLLPLTLFIAACAGVGGPASEPEPPQLDLAGVYDCTMSFEGQQMPGTLTITGTPGAYSGTVAAQQGGTAIEDVTVDGNHVTFLVSPMPEIAIFFDLTFEGDSFTGTLDGGQFGGNISGKKR